MAQCGEVTRVHARVCAWQPAAVVGANPPASHQERLRLSHNAPVRACYSRRKHEQYGEINIDLSTGTLGEDPEAESIAVSAMVAVSLLPACAMDQGGTRVPTAWAGGRG